MILTKEFENWLGDLLLVKEYQDYCPNGLQVEGVEQLKKIAFAVSCSLDVLEKCDKWKPDALVVHHGILWDYQGGKKITGAYYKKLKILMDHQINLFAYHLPLDGHPEYGNSAGLLRSLSISEEFQPFGKYKGMPIGLKSQFSKPISAQQLSEKLGKILQRNVLYGPLLLSNSNAPSKIKTIGIITGGAGKYWEEASKLRLDAFITGEISEHHYHDAREAGLYLFAAGHHATERFGVLNLMKLIKEKNKKIEVTFFDSDNPI